MLMIFRICQHLLIICKCIAKAVILWFIPKREKDISRDVILVTGGGRGIGRQLALSFAKHKPSQIILWGRHGDTLQSTCDEVKNLGVLCTYMVCDVGDREQVYKCAEKVKSSVGDVTILVNNAGVVFGQLILDSSEEQIQTTIKTNILAHFWTVKSFIPSMLESNYGHIVVLSSLLGLTGMKRAGDYVSSKFATTGMADALREELRIMGKTGVTVTSVHPYQVENEMFAGLKTRLSGWLLPPLTETYVADQTVRAVLRDQPVLILPRLMYFVIWFLSWTPNRVILEMAKLTGLSSAMDTFHGRLKQE
ncbi:short-chain dehydrogenase/reductase 3-like [Gigantopelta aegis]|uniref:short-chain dehydrogenase/reductase 3-like n=1 Tax=Gigantopelta aegis TaxID=1735272 RepID=UPI001B887545|nr:short-chain dehydrogenase/reductase 3-like [Gigantopelta aegis]